MGKWRHLLWVVVVAVVLSACTRSAAPATSTGTPASGASAPTAAGTGFKEVPREKTVIFENIDGRVPTPENMNPYIAGNYLDWGMWQATQEALFYYNYETGEMMPWLATGYSYNDDCTQVTITLREGVEWSDGQPFTAQDVVFTINMLKQHPELMYGADMQDQVADVVASDEHTVVLTLNRSNPRFVLQYFGVRIWDTVLIAPKHIWEDKDPLTFTNYDLAKGWPVGTGPYRLVRSTETETVFDRRDDWWAAKIGFHKLPEPERAIWIAAPTEDLRAAKATNNELDAMWIFSRGSFEVARSKNPNIIGWTQDLPYAYLDPCPRYLGLNNKVKPFDDRDIRWAVNYCLDRNEIVKIAYEGMTEPAEALYPTYPSLKAFLDRNEAAFAQYPVLKTDLAKSEEIMTGKGYVKDSEGFWVGPDGKRVSFSIIVRSGEADKMKMGPIIVEQLRRGGFDASLQPLETAVFYNDVNKGAAQAFLEDSCASVSDPYDLLARFHSRNSAPIGEDSLHGFRFENAEFDAAVDALARLRPDDPAFAAQADQTFAIWLRELPAIPLVQARLLTPFNTTYWTGWPTAENNYVQPGHWWVTGNQILLNIKPAR